MRSVSVPMLDGLIGNIPAVSSASYSFASPVPSGYVARVLIWDTDGKAIQGDPAVETEMEDVFMTIVKESVGVYGLDMSNVDFDAASVAFMINVDGFNPMDHILENKVSTHALDHLERAPRVHRS